MNARPDVPPEIADLLSGAGRERRIPPEALANLALRLEKTLAIPRLNVPLRDELAGRAGLAGHHSVAAGVRGFVRHRAAFGFGMYLIGALSAVGVQQGLSRRENQAPSSAAVPQPSASSTPSPWIEAERLPTPAQPTVGRATGVDLPSARPTHAPAVASSAPVAVVRSMLADERHLLEVARAALSRARPQEALAALDEHARRYPAGELDEESESMRVDALVAAGSYEEARAAAERFNTKYPGSMLRASVSRALRSIP